MTERVFLERPDGVDQVDELSRRRLDKALAADPFATISMYRVADGSTAYVVRYGEDLDTWSVSMHLGEIAQKLEDETELRLPGSSS